MRIRELDGLRAIMIFIVSWYHIWQQSWLTPHIGGYSLDFLLRSGYVWVDGTVLLSAFLLFLPYARTMLLGKPMPDAASFYYRRARRILPSYYFNILLILFAVVLPFGLYVTPQYMVKDLATHFTFTFTFFEDTYLFTPLGGACWTVAIEVQAYLLIPLAAKAILKKPVLTMCLLTGVCFCFRAWCVWALEDYNMVVNQLINFLDVYVIGILLAMLYVRISSRAPDKTQTRIRTLAATLLFAVSVFILFRMLRVQAFSPTHPDIQRNQMLYRPIFALCFGGMILSCSFAVKPLRWLLGNKVMVFLAGISMNYYLIHQVIIVHMRRIGFPPSESQTPHMVGEQPWQTQYVLAAFGISFAAAVLITYLVERPAAKLMDRLHDKKRARPDGR